MKPRARERLRAPAPVATRPVQRKRVARGDIHSDRYEQEAERAAESVRGRGRAPARGLALSRIAPGQVQRQDTKPKTEEDKYKEAAKKVGEAFLQTEAGKKLKAQVMEDPLVKGTKEAAESFVSTLPGKVITGTAAAGAIAALAVTHKELPMQLPDIPLDSLTPGLSMSLTYEGPVDNPTKAMLTFTYREQAPKSKAAKKTATERQREENARLSADIAKFKAGMRFMPGSEADRRQKAEDAAMQKAIESRVGGLPTLTPAPTTLGFDAPLGPTGSSIGKPKPFSLLDKSLELKPAAEVSPSDDLEKKKKEEGTPVMRKAAHPGPGHQAPAVVDDVLSAGGSPLDPATRAEMEARFGHDFSHVRIHTDSRASRSADAIDAEAYTAGGDVVFGFGRFQPHSHAGRALLAHELAHVVQQTDPAVAGGGIQRKPKPKAAPAKFYQEAVDSLDSIQRDLKQQRSQGSYIPLEPLHYKGLKALVPLCEAVDAERVADIPKLLEEYIAAESGIIQMAISESLLHELAARMIKLGLEKESLRLRKHYNDRVAFRPGYDPGASRRRVDFFTRLVDYSIGLADSSTPAAVLQSLEFLVRAYIPLRNALSEIDWDAVAADRRMGLAGTLMTRPWMSRTEYADLMLDLARRLFTAIEMGFQSLVETAITELSTGSGSSTLKLARTFLDKRLRPAVFDKPNVAWITLKITRTTIKKGGQGKSEDMFATGAEARRRSVVVSTYDPEQEYAQELEASVAKLVTIRDEQLLTLAQIYGATDLIPREKDFGGALSDDAKRNAETIKKLNKGRLRLHSDDDWRAFVRQKFLDLTTPSGALLKKSDKEAFKAIIELLFGYLQTFTVHARFTNVYDIGDSYLNRDFPRALSGQLVHDCGVYALRVAYILSLVRQDLKLRFRYVVLPAHVALVIDGDTIPTYIVHNDTFHELTDVTEDRKQWEQFSEEKEVTDAKGNVTTVDEKPKGPRDETQFIGEKAAATEILGPLDTPFVVVDVPKAAGDAKAAQATMWAHYQKASTTKVFGAASEKKSNDKAYLFHQRYLALTERLRDIHNTTLLPFWNEAAPPLWAALEKELAGGDGKRTRIAASELAALLEKHLTAFAAAHKPMQDRINALHDEERRISETMRTEPGLQRQGVRLGYGPRAATLWRYKTVLYMSGLTRFIAGLKKTPTNQIEITTVRTTLEPPFLEAKLTPLD
jgi:hypothetical protein